jgi:hypothetical protein
MKGEFALLRGTFGLSIAVSVLGLFFGSGSEARVEQAAAPVAPAVIVQSAPAPQLSAEEQYLIERCGPNTSAREHVKCRSKVIAEMSRAQRRAKKAQHSVKPSRPKSSDNDKAFELDDYLLPEYRAPANRPEPQPEAQEQR